VRPSSTYRLQLHAGFTLRDAAALVPYLVRLGVGAVYLSPVWQAVPGSQHGYDVLAPDVVNPELGGLAALEALAARAHDAGLGVVLDIVPNHQAADPRNPRWRAVLLDGEASPFAHWFDIDWRGNDLVPPGKVLLPVLDTPVREAFADGSLQLVADGEVHAFALGDVRYPVRGPVGPEARAGSVDALAEIADRQAYVLGEWRRTRTARNYRRFFDVDGLVGVRVDELDVFATTHALVVDLARRGVADGVRIDHVDGLADPAEYLERLAEALPRRALIVVEKILGAGEQLPAWPVDGTTGYEWAARLHVAQIDAEGRRRLLDAAPATGSTTISRSSTTPPSARSSTGSSMLSGRGCRHACPTTSARHSTSSRCRSTCTARTSAPHAATRRATVPCSRARRPSQSVPARRLPASARWSNASPTTLSWRAAGSS
jgi:(1->4)-alpha-D-glucan 1-alpha-D-glucosylmutase